MRKVIFIDYNNLIKKENIKIRVNSPINEKKLMEINPNCTYFTIIKQNNKYLLFFKDKPSKDDKLYKIVGYYSGDYTYYMEGDNPFKFGGRRLIIEDPAISHNAVPFYDKNNNIKVLGGLHWSKDFYKEKVVKKEKHIFIDYEGHMIVNPKKVLKNVKCNGIYLFNKEGDKLKYVRETPIVNGSMKGLVNKRKNHPISEFDGRSIIVYFKNKYIIYIRSNIMVADGSIGVGDKDRKTNVKGGGVRAVQYAVSEDCIKWSEFKFIDIDFDYKRDNIYFFGVQKYSDDILLSIFPYSNGKEGYIGISFSHDGISWTKVRKFIDSKISKTNNDRVIDFSIHHVIEYGDKMLFYIHRNYIWWEAKNNKNYITYMELGKDRITSINSGKGEFSVIIKDVERIGLNYKVNKGGYIMVKIGEDKNYNYDNFDKLKKEDSIYEELSWCGKRYGKRG